MTTPPPTVGCPTCSAPLSVVSDCCGICGRTFQGRELWEHYEESLASHA